MYQRMTRAHVLSWDYQTTGPSAQMYVYIKKKPNNPATYYVVL
jgi:hypothetical protein